MPDIIPIHCAMVNIFSSTKLSLESLTSANLNVFNIKDNEGELIIKIEDDLFGDSLFSFMQGLLKITDVTYLTRERVRSTFLEDFRQLISDNIQQDRRDFDWHDPVRDPQGMYKGIPLFPSYNLKNGC